MPCLQPPSTEPPSAQYAKAGFGEYLGFFSAFGYWASACAGNVTYWVLITSTVGAVWPALGDGDTVLAVIVSTAGLWAFFLLIRRDVKEAAAINRVVTVAKVVPIIVFVITPRPTTCCARRASRSSRSWGASWAAAAGTA